MVNKEFDQTCRIGCFKYFSYNYTMAAYHTEKIKLAIVNNPFYSDLKDHKKAAESVLKFSWDGKTFITLDPRGLLEFKRGIHCPLIYVDDPFQDPANKLLLTNIKEYFFVLCEDN